MCWGDGQGVPGAARTAAALAYPVTFLAESGYDGWCGEKARVLGDDLGEPLVTFAFWDDVLWCWTLSAWRNLRVQRSRQRY